MKIPISERLLTCCSFVKQGERVADIGCDHGYLGLYLLASGIASHVYASDVRELPLACAKQNAVRYDVTNRIDFFLSDGTISIPRDYDCMVCAGMGADTIIGILEASPWLHEDCYRMVLQCQSKLPTLRRFLYQNKFTIRNETLVRDGRFLYSVMEVCPGEYHPESEWEHYLSAALRYSGSPLLAEFTDRLIRNISLALHSCNSNDETGYLNDLLTQLTVIREEFS